MSEDYEMDRSIEELSGVVVGRRIVQVDKLSRKGWDEGGIKLTLDDGTVAEVRGSGDCCAHTEIDSFLADPNAVDHIITNVVTDDDYQTWHILADLTDVLKLDVSWSEGTGYYSYGFRINVVKP